MEEKGGLKSSPDADSTTYQIHDGIRCQYGDGAVVMDLILRDRPVQKMAPVVNVKANDNVACAVSLSSGFGALVAGAKCPVCFCTPGDDGIEFIILPCKHVYCNGCYQSWLTRDSHRTFPVMCLAEGCSRMLRLTDLASTIASKEMTKLLRAALDHHVRMNSYHFRLCEASDCGGVIERNGDTSSGMCSTCSCSFCFTCHASHENMTCKDYRLATLPPDQVRIKIVEEILTLRCPRCRTAFLDFDGCFALHCASCGCAFCGWCFKDCASDAHPHVSSCTYKEVGVSQYHGTLEMFHAAQTSGARNS